MDIKKILNKCIYIENKNYKKHKFILIVSSVIGFLFMPFLSSFLHEVGHFVLAKASGFYNVRLFVYYPFGGQTIFDIDWFLPLNNPQWVKLKLVTIAGSISECLVMGLINILVTFYKKIPFSVSLPIFSSTLAMIINQVLYWVSGVSADPYLFINAPPQMDPVVIRFLSACIGVIVLILLTLGFYYRVKKTIKTYKDRKDRNLKEINLFFTLFWYLFIVISGILLFCYFMQTIPFFIISIP